LKRKLVKYARKARVWMGWFNQFILPQPTNVTVTGWSRFWKKAPEENKQAVFKVSL